MSLVSACAPARPGGGNVRRAIYTQRSDLLATPDAMTLAAAWKDTHRPGPFPGRRLLANWQTSKGVPHTYLLLLLLHGEGDGLREGPAVARRNQRWLAPARSPAPLVSPKHVPARGALSAKPRHGCSFRSSPHLCVKLFSPRVYHQDPPTALSRQPSCPIFYCLFSCHCSRNCGQSLHRASADLRRVSFIKFALKGALTLRHCQTLI